MTTHWRLLRDGVRLAFLRTPQHTPLEAGLRHWAGIAALGLALELGWHWFQVDAPREFNNYGLQSAFTGMVLRFIACAVLCGLTDRRALFWSCAGWTEAAALPIGAVAGALIALAPHQALDAHWLAWVLAVTWSAIVWLRLAFWLRPRHVASGLAAVLALIVTVAPWFGLDGQRLWRTDWSDYAASDEEYREPGELEAPEAAMYAQGALLDAELASLAPQRADRIDLFALAFGGDASEDVFRNEVEYVERLFAQRFDAAGHTLALLNHPDSADTRPLATATNLERALLGLGKHMDRDNDIAFLYLTSHGSDSHELYVNQPPLPLDQLTPERLRAALDAAGIRWRVIVVSACYSGGYVDALRDPGTLVITAASKDRTSFGCGSASKITWFGKAFLAEALNAGADFIAAQAQAEKTIRAWEKERDIEASQPQIDIGTEIAAQLQRWQAGFEPGPALPFTLGAKAKSARQDKPSSDG